MLYLDSGTDNPATIRKSKWNQGKLKYAPRKLFTWSSFWNHMRQNSSESNAITVSCKLRN